LPTAELDDAMLVAGVVAGRPAALAALFDRYASVARTVVARTLGSWTDVDDVVQEVFLTVAKRCDTLRDVTALRSFVVSVAIRTARNEYRKRTVRRWVGLEAVPASRATRAHDDDVSEQVRRVYDALGEIGVEGRIAFILRRIEGYELAEAATLAGCSLATFKRRLARAEAQFEALCRADPMLCRLLEGGRS
jgi:RNA polymerase sigma-70 factor (ECF subfamily)